MVSSTSTAVSQWVEGMVSKVDANGFALTASGRAGSAVRRYLLSRYASPRPTLPSEGQRVRVGLDKSGYVRVIEVLPSVPDAPTPTLLAAPVSAATPPGLSVAPTPAEPSGNALAEPPASIDAAVTEPDELPFPSSDWPPAEQSAPAPPRPILQHVQPQPGRAVVARRLACLNAAATILAGRAPAAAAAAVLALAEQFERWAMRPEDAEDAQ